MRRGISGWRRCGFSADQHHTRDADPAEHHDDEADKAEEILRPLETLANLILCRLINYRALTNRLRSFSRMSRVRPFAAHLQEQLVIRAKTRRPVFRIFGQYRRGRETPGNPPTRRPVPIDEAANGERACRSSIGRQPAEQLRPERGAGVSE